ncbi:MAG TPA: sulfate reduction electron transfer complex DsrMKJOP subunit DsrJ [Longimicrobiales bacterium]|nr:sulfate reduction electron transfer complex DsrMKJOP subunit DsrJ [Longimicrobiales bacterium]
MSDRPRIVAGLGLFLVLAAYPVWSALASTGDPSPPVLARAQDSAGCVEDTLYMAAHHADVLNAWRTSVVRDGERFYTSTAGRQWEMSLTGTCLQCHDDSQAFCERCHTYAQVELTCWGCHVAPEGQGAEP